MNRRGRGPPPTKPAPSEQNCLPLWEKKSFKQVVVGDIIRLALGRYDPPADCVLGARTSLSLTRRIRPVERKPLVSSTLAVVQMEPAIPLTL